MMAMTTNSSTNVKARRDELNDEAKEILGIAALPDTV
jgi:hypothetical protein